ncbi:pitrilysin family protein [Ignatzschineria larvae DSM 13226]|uniref:Pitrilysin family protein n=1 Tax=Ignatzschineria larvae DSM 13226 TaxID=1111732 RepID=A0ABZ3C0K4_9GAMM|nr:pitrilysin family protein [Ignatzschineria larvae]
MNKLFPLTEYAQSKRLNLKKIAVTLMTTTALLLGIAHANTAPVKSPSETKTRTVETWKTAEGADVYYRYAPEIPIVDLIVAVDAGSFRDGEQYGLASMTANMMTKGSGDLDEEAFLIQLDQLQSSIGVSSNLQQTRFSLRSLADEIHLQPSLTLFYDVLAHPQFDEAIFEREITQAIDGEKALLDDPASIASELYYQTLYPNGYLGVTSEMLQASLKKLKVEDLKQFRDQFYHANQAKIVFVGDISQDEAKNIAAQVSQLLGKGEAHTALAEKNKKVAPTRVERYFDSPQTQVILGQAGIDRFDPDYLPLIVGNHLLGGSGLTSMLMTTIREKDGLTYGIYSSFMPLSIAGPYSIRFSTKNESVDEAIDKTKAVIRDFIANGPEADALQRAKNNFVGSLVLDLDSNAKQANSILNLATYGLPLDYYETLPEKVAAITPEEIQAAFKAHVNPDEMVTIIVGGDVAQKTDDAIETK